MTAQNESDKNKPRQPNARGDTKSKNAEARVLRRYDRMWLAFQRKQTAAYVAREAGVAWETAKRAIEEGWPRYNLLPLKEKWAHVTSEAQRVSDYDLATRLAETLRYSAVVDGMVGQIATKLGEIDYGSIFNEEAIRQLGPRETLKTLETIISLLEKSAKLRAYVAGKPESVKEIRHEVEVVQHVRRIQDMADGELDEIISRAKEAGRVEAVAEKRADFVAFIEDLLSRHRTDLPLLPAVTETPSAGEDATA